MDPALLCRIFFGIGTAIAIGGPLLPPFRKHIMNYGPRNTAPTSSIAEPASLEGNIIRLLKYIGSFQVPHTWFSHYYIISVASSMFWALQIYIHGTAFEFLASLSKSTSSTMTSNQAVLVWLLMAIQGARRLYESLTFTRPSQSTMWAGLWIIGMAFYIFMGISVWIEGIASLDHVEPRETLLEILRPTGKSLVAVPLFLLASFIQHECHKHLASLKKYSLPESFWFRFVLCPHYTSECLIYLAIAGAAAPGGQILNKTVLAGLAFVASNLAVTADSTKRWYSKKFGVEKVAGRWRMIPYVY